MCQIVFAAGTPPQTPSPRWEAHSAPPDPWLDLSWRGGKVMESGRGREGRVSDGGMGRGRG